MDNEAYKASIQERMITITERIVTKKTHPLEGIRELLKLRHEIDLSNDEIFLDKLTRWRFPSPLQGTIIEVAYPFMFSSKR